MIVAIAVEDVSIADRGAAGLDSKQVRRNPDHLEFRVNEGAVVEVVFEGDLESVRAGGVGLPDAIAGRFPGGVVPRTGALVGADERLEVRFRVHRFFVLFFTARFFTAFFFFFGLM